MVDDITQGVANLLQTTDDDNSQGAEHFLQNLTTAVTTNQSALNQVNSNVEDLQNAIQALNAARNTNNPRGGYNNQQQQQPPQSFQPVDYSRAYRQAPLNGPSNPQQGQMPFMMQPPSFQPQFHQRSQFSNQQQQAFQPPQHGGRGRGREDRRTCRSSNGNPNNWNQRNSNRPPAHQPRNNHYCWTCGACAHPSSQCQTPAMGHQWNASFRNRFNGNAADVWNT